MLILTRRPGETIKIGDNIEVTVLGVQGSLTKIGINAPREIEVHREEVYRRIQLERAQSQESAIESVPADA